MSQAHKSHLERFLVAVLNAHLHASGTTPADIARHHQFGRSEAALSRVLTGKTNAPHGGWDDFLSDYCAATGADPMDLWHQAMSAWEADREAHTRKAAARIRRAAEKARES